MSLAHTIVSGYLKNKDGEKVDIQFALVFLKNGVYKIKTRLPSENLIEKDKGSSYLELVGITDEGIEIECKYLFLTKHQMPSNKVQFLCEGYVRFTEKPTPLPHTPEENEREMIWFAEVENLKMAFGSKTYINKSTNSSIELDTINNVEFDHTETGWIINGLENNGNSFTFRIFKNPANSNHLIDFRRNENERTTCRLYYDEYLLIRKDLLSLLSFMNGARVYLRTEFLGETYGMRGKKGYYSQIMHRYSFKKQNDSYRNDYIKINYHHSRSSMIFYEFFHECFEDFQKYNEVLDFDSLIYSLNSSTQTKGLEERYFILITAFERLARKYAEYKASLNQEKEPYYIDNDIFQKDIKPKLVESLKGVKRIDKKAWNRFNAIVSNMNTKQNSTINGLYDFLEFAKIPISDSVKRLVEEERHMAVHEGKIGNNTEEMYKNYLKLDHILRDCILNIIGYHSLRHRKGLYATEEEFEKANPKTRKNNRHFVIK